MIALRDALAAAGVSGPTALTLGVFDGVHLGHRHLLRALHDDAAARGLVSVALTFSNHPLAVLRPELDIVMLTPIGERIELIRTAGVDHVVPVAFTAELSQLSAEQFVTTLRDTLDLRHLVLGPDFALGQGRAGTPPVLTALGQHLGYSVRVVEPLVLERGPARSTAIRDSLAAGDVEAAAEILGRPFSLAAPVVAGEGRGGGELGFPTCNLGLGASQALPADGIYAAWVLVDDQCLPAAASVGTKPTFHDVGPRVVEAFVLDFDGDLYGKDVRIEFVCFIRPQERFASAAELAAQIALDVEATRASLALGQAAKSEAG